MKENQEKHEFSKLIRYTLWGYGLALLSALILDSLKLQKNAFGQWLVRTLSGEGESIFEGIYAIKQRITNSTFSLAQAYGWGKVIGMTFPWFIDAVSRLTDIDVYGIEGFYIPYFYALSDQIGANIAGLLFFKRNHQQWKAALKHYLRNPVMLTSLLIIIIVPMGLLAARAIGFSPTTQLYTALETIAANLCWLPPLVGWLYERSEQKRSSYL